MGVKTAIDPVGYTSLQSLVLWHPALLINIGSFKSPLIGQTLRSVYVSRNMQSSINEGGGGGGVSLVPTLSTRCATRGGPNQILSKILAGYISLIQCVIAFKVSQCVDHTKDSLYAES